MKTVKRLNIVSLNAHLICVICSGYYVEATTIVECLHTFCRSCIIGYLKTNKFCPICDVQVHGSKPWFSLRPDKTMQDLVYKLVPGLYQDEMKRRREFYSALGEANTGTGESEEKGYLPHGARFFAQDDSISLSLEYYTGQNDSDGTDEINPVNGKSKRYLQCPAAVTVRHLKKFLQMKYGIGVDSWVDIIYNDECLPDYFSLIDVAYTFGWRRASPMRLSYRIFTKKVVNTIKTGTVCKAALTFEEQKKDVGQQTSSLEQQKQSEYLGNFNLNPTKSEFCRNQNNNSNEAKNNYFSEVRDKTCMDELHIDEGSGDKLFPLSEDSNGSGLKIILEKEESLKGNSEESTESVIVEEVKTCNASVQNFSEEAEDGFAATKLLKNKHKPECKKEKKKHDALEGGEKRKRNPSPSESAEEKKDSLDGKKRRKSTGSGANDDSMEEEEPLANLKNEALRKVFVLKDKCEVSPKEKEPEEMKKKKRKKSKHHEGEFKKRKVDFIPTSPSILSFAKDPLKLKVKLTPIIKASTEEKDQKPAEKEGDKRECDNNKTVRSEPEKEKDDKKIIADKERLLHLRAVRHKTITKNSPSYISAPRSLTISKVDASEQLAKPRIVETRPSLEIMLVPPSDTSKTKNSASGDAEKKTDSSKNVTDNFGVLDLSDKSTRVKEGGLPPPKETAEIVERGKKSTQQSIMQIAQNLVNRKLPPKQISSDKRFDTVIDPTTNAAAMRNLQTLSDTAVNILMAAQSKGFPSSPESTKKTFPVVSNLPAQKSITIPTKDCENGTGLKIPIFPISRERANPIPPVPNLHEIYPKNRGRPITTLPRLAPTPIKPGQNQTVRQIPNPSALLNRQNSQLISLLSLPPQNFTDNNSSELAAKASKLSNIPPLQSIKTKLIISSPENGAEKAPAPKYANNKTTKTVQNGSDITIITGPVKKVEETKKVNANMMRRIENMTRSIETVAAGLTARAVSNAMVDAK